MAKNAKFKVQYVIEFESNNTDWFKFELFRGALMGTLKVIEHTDAQAKLTKIEESVGVDGVYYGAMSLLDQR